MQRPTGIVTFLFTDIEGSTKLWENHPEWMPRAHKRHETIIRDAAIRHDGFVYKMIGDAFQIAFANARDALAAAMDAQRGLSKGEAFAITNPPENQDRNKPIEISKDVNAANASLLQLRVRMALHTGITEERADDYVGPLLNRIARLLSAAHGGQILLSQATCDLVHDQLFPKIILRDLGEHRLKDLLRAEHIYQLVAPNLPADFPPLASLDLFPNNLPNSLTNFIGRERELADIQRVLAQSRLVTLTGPGGCGKTRAALEIAHLVLNEFSHGVWYIELAALTDPLLVPHRVAAVFGLREQNGRALLDSLREYLNAKKILLVLDNCEHLIEASARLADTLLQTCSNLKILATSREPLQIVGETTARISSLPVFDPHQMDAPDLIARAREMEAVRLFIDRARNVQPQFALTSENARALAEIVARVDGIPLAIELAAARVNALAPEEIAARLRASFALVTGGSRTALPRQKTLRALIDWSFDLLSEPERILFQRLAIFSGGWTLEEAESVCSLQKADGSDSNLPSADRGLPTNILDLLSRLVDKSLVNAEEQHGGARYRMLETIRQYALDRLLESSDVESLRARHLDYFLQCAENAEPKLRGAEQLHWFQILETEHDNLRAASEWAARANWFEKNLRLISALWFFCWVRGHWSEWHRRLMTVLTRADYAAIESRLPPRVRLRGLFARGFFSCALGDVTMGRAALEQSLALAREIGAEAQHELGVGLAYLGYFLLRSEPERAREFSQESLAVSRSANDQWVTAVAVSVLGMLAAQEKKFQAARDLFSAQLDLFRAVGDRRLLGIAHSILGDTLFEEGDWRGARAQRMDALTIYQAIGDKQNCAFALSGLGDVAMVERDFAQAEKDFADALALWQDLGHKDSIATLLDNLGVCARAEKNFVRAHAYHAQALQLRTELGAPANQIASLMAFANLARAQNQFERAARLVGALENMRADSLAFQNEMQNFFVAARAEFSETEFQAARAEGRAMTWAQ
ncbi:MAG: tetratricopeptide repeat protein, partial [Chloroflexi bacterium]|nr:tetratricopeptide repeat protein [Chloroflexota bacterium]